MDIIYFNEFGGLGDNLQYSTLPELFVQKGDQFLVHPQTPFRNPEIYDLIWGCNLYVRGRSKPHEIPNVGSVIPYRNMTGNMIENSEVLHGFSPTNKYPKIYYPPQSLKGYNDVVLVDVSTITESYNSQKIFETIELLKEAKYSGKNLISVRFSKKLNDPSQDKFHQGRHLSYDISNLCKDTIEITSIFSYCDLLGNVDGYISVHSGGHALASAIKNQYNQNLDNVCIIRNENYNKCLNSALHLYDNVEYALIND